MKKIFGFFKNVKKEMEKVKWPSKNNMLKYTFTAVSFIFFFAIFYAALDVVIALVKAMGA